MCRLTRDAFPHRQVEYYPPAASIASAADPKQVVAVPTDEDSSDSSDDEAAVQLRKDKKAGRGKISPALAHLGFYAASIKPGKGHGWVGQGQCNRQSFAGEQSWSMTDLNIVCQTHRTAGGASQPADQHLRVGPARSAGSKERQEGRDPRGCDPENEGGIDARLPSCEPPILPRADLPRPPLTFSTYSDRACESSARTQVSQSISQTVALL